MAAVRNKAAAQDCIKGIPWQVVTCPPPRNWFESAPATRPAGALRSVHGTRRFSAVLGVIASCGRAPDSPGCLPAMPSDMSRRRNRRAIQQQSQRPFQPARCGWHGQVQEHIRGRPPRPAGQQTLDEGLAGSGLGCNAGRYGSNPRCATGPSSASIPLTRPEPPRQRLGGLAPVRRTPHDTSGNASTCRTDHEAFHCLPSPGIDGPAAATIETPSKFKPLGKRQIGLVPHCEHRVQYDESGAEN